MNTYALFADFVVFLHLSYVLFVVLGLVLVLVGGVCHWSWVRNSWFRMIHLTMIGIVVVESLLSITCPLTTLEAYLRSMAGQTPQAGSFVGRLAHNLLFYDLSPQFFTFAYCAFAAAVVATMLFVPPRLLYAGRLANSSAAERQRPSI